MPGRGAAGGGGGKGGAGSERGGRQGGSDADVGIGAVGGGSGGVGGGRQVNTEGGMRASASPPSRASPFDVSRASSFEPFQKLRGAKCWGDMPPPAQKHVGRGGGGGRGAEGAANRLRPKSAGSWVNNKFQFRGVPGAALGLASPRVELFASLAALHAAKDSFSQPPSVPHAATGLVPGDDFTLPAAILPGSILALRMEREQRMQHRHGADKYAGEFVRASGLPVPPNQKDQRKRMSGLSLYELSTAERPNDPAHTQENMWGFDAQEGISIVQASNGVGILTGAWREREQERDKIAAKERTESRQSLAALFHKEGARGGGGGSGGGGVGSLGRVGERVGEGVGERTPLLRSSTQHWQEGINSEMSSL